MVVFHCSRSLFFLLLGKGAALDAVLSRICKLRVETFHDIYSVSQAVKLQRISSKLSS